MKPVTYKSFFGITLTPEVNRPSLSVRRPGLNPDSEFHEQYVIAGGGWVRIKFSASDAAALIDTEGLQRLLVVARANLLRGNEVITSNQALNFSSMVAQDWLAQWMQVASDEAKSFYEFTVVEALNFAEPIVATLFSGEQLAKSRIDLNVLHDCELIFCALPHPDGAHLQRASTPIVLNLQRAKPPPKPAGLKGVYRLPAALVEPRTEFPVSRGTARAYEVKAGEYIQVIDPFGRQCSDFIAFDHLSLKQGRERFIDSTVSRSMVRASYPMPGLLDKFYDQDMSPLLRVVQDTCGRHDTFALACTERGYSDSGYVGHANCSDNISQAAKPFGVAERRAWPAINFFFNTLVSAGNALTSDEGWSLPGDFVLMRAEKDLLCISTACPDDTTAINGWNPTDIHVRIYPPQPSHMELPRAHAFRKTPESSADLTRETGFHPRTSRLTRHFRQAREYWVPTQFTEYGVAAEYAACRQAVTVMDMSQLCKFDVVGPDAEELLQRTLTRDVRTLSNGQVLYSLLCYEHGGLLDDGTLLKFGPNNFRWIGGNPLDGDWLRGRAEAFGLSVFVRTATLELNNLSMQGPLSRQLLTNLIWSPDTQPRLSELKWFRFLIGRLNDRVGPALLVSRTGFTGELGYELFCTPKDSVALWDAVWTAGAPLGLVPMGSDALEILRIEAGLASGGNEFSSETDPFEAGLGFAAPPSKTEDYVGREAINLARQHSKRVLVGLGLVGSEVPSHGDGVYMGQAKIGQVTSATRSPVAGRAIAMARIAAQYATVGTDLEVGRLDGQQKRLKAVVRPLPFHDPEKRRIRA
jgi:aminomethyltransferase